MIKESFKDFLISKAVSYKALAKVIGINNITISNHANGLQNISINSAKKYSKFFGLRLDEFVNRFVI